MHFPIVVVIVIPAIGLDGNQRTVLRRKVHADDLVAAETPQILAVTMFTTFCITVDRKAGIITVAHQGKPPFLTYQDPIFINFRYFGFASGPDQVAYWLFPKALEPQKCKYDLWYNSRKPGTVAVAAIQLDLYSNSYNHGKMVGTPAAIPYAYH